MYGRALARRWDPCSREAQQFADFSGGNLETVEFSRKLHPVRLSYLHSHSAPPQHSSGSAEIHS